MGKHEKLVYPETIRKKRFHKAGRSALDKESSQTRMPGMRCAGAVSLPAITSTPKAKGVFAIKAL